ncbi:hypothetical protein BDR07DRAFT_1387219, partial [Suillus spraguei]
TASLILTSTTSLIPVVRTSPSTVSLGRDLFHGRQFNLMTMNVTLFHMSSPSSLHPTALLTKISLNISPTTSRLLR